jgi:hypothetical protein
MGKLKNEMIELSERMPLMGSVTVKMWRGMQARINLETYQWRSRSEFKNVIESIKSHLDKDSTNSISSADNKEIEITTWEKGSPVDNFKMPLETFILIEEMMEGY